MWLPIRLGGNPGRGSGILCGASGNDPPEPGNPGWTAESSGLDPLLKKWLEADQEVVKSPGSVIVQSGKLDPVPWNTDEHLVWVEFKTVASPEKMPRYGQNIGLKGDQIKEFGDITQKASRGSTPRCCRKAIP